MENCKKTATYYDKINNRGKWLLVTKKEIESYEDTEREITHKWYLLLSLFLTSSGADKVTVGELRLRGRLIWGSLKWLLLLAADPTMPSSAS